MSDYQIHDLQNRVARLEKLMEAFDEAIDEIWTQVRVSYKDDPSCHAGQRVESQEDYFGRR